MLVEVVEVLPQMVVEVVLEVLENLQERLLVVIQFHQEVPLQRLL